MALASVARALFEVLKPLPFKLTAALIHELRQLIELTGTHGIIISEAHRPQPELASVVSTANMDVRRLMTLVAIKKKDGATLPVIRQAHASLAEPRRLRSSN